MKKHILTALICLFACNCKVFADSIVFENGNILNGKINFILSGAVEIKTENGIRSVIREIPSGKALDLVEIGFFKRKKIFGEVYYLDDKKIELKTDTGLLTISRYKVREITLAQ
ncbi:MAG: hypothetical protein PHV68_06070 [Candidatus Gastranaerophilales bacterium]|nr:hypothetical protein [Candidatus Gastranaerophilales bacterium]